MKRKPSFRSRIVVDRSKFPGFAETTRLRDGSLATLRALGLSWESIKSIQSRPDPTCAICHRKGELVVDHDHDTNSFRDLLCQQCNNGLGQFGDSPTTLLKAVFYLKRHGKLK